MKKAPKAQARYASSTAVTTSADGRIRREATDGTGQVFGYSFARLTARQANVLLENDTKFVTPEFIDLVSLQIDGFSDPLDADADRLTAAGFDIVDFTLAAGRLNQLTASPPTRRGS